MREFQERRRIKKLLHSRYAIIALAAVCLMVANAVWGVYNKYEKSGAIASRMQAETAALQIRENSLKASIAALSTPEGKEKEIHDRFGALKDGERMVILVDGPSDSKQGSDAGQSGWWSRFIGFFGL